MAEASMKIGLDKDVYELFHSTRLTFCSTFDCRFNSFSAPTCELKRIMIEDGKCKNYEKKENVK
jgi:hypothetical protein